VAVVHNGIEKAIDAQKKADTFRIRLPRHEPPQTPTTPRDALEAKNDAAFAELQEPGTGVAIQRPTCEGKGSACHRKESPSPSKLTGPISKKGKKFECVLSCRGKREKKKGAHYARFVEGVGRREKKTEHNPLSGGTTRQESPYFIEVPNIRSGGEEFSRAGLVKNQRGKNPSPANWGLKKKEATGGKRAARLLSHV